MRKLAIIIVSLIVVLTAAFLLFSTFKGKKEGESVSILEGITSFGKKEEVKEIPQINLVELLKGDYLIFSGVKNAEDKLQGFMESNFIEVMEERLEKGKIFKTNSLINIKGFLGRVKDASSFEGEEDATYEVFGYNSLVAVYEEEVDDKKVSSYVFLAQPRTHNTLNKLKEKVTDEFISYKFGSFECFITRGNFIAFKDNTFFISDNYELLDSLITAEPQKEEPSSDEEEKDYIKERLEDIYGDSEGSYFYCLLPLETILDKATINIRNLTENIELNAFEEAFFVFKISDLIESEVFLKLKDVEEESYITELFDITPSAYKTLNFAPKDVYRAEVNTSFKPKSWRKLRKSMAKNKKKTGINKKFSYDAVFDLLEEELNFDLEEDIDPHFSGEFCFILNGLTYDDGKESGKSKLWGSYCIIAKMEDPGSFEDIIKSKVSETNEKFRESIKLSKEEEVPEVFSPIKMGSRKLDGESDITINYLDIGKYVTNNNYKDNRIEYAYVDGFFLLGSDIEPMINTYLKKEDKVSDGKMFAILSKKIPQIDKAGTFAYFSPKKYGEWTSNALVRATMASIDEDLLPFVDEDRLKKKLKANTLGWLGDCLVKSEGDGQWYYSKSVFSLNDMSADDWRFVLGMAKGKGSKK